MLYLDAWVNLDEMKFVLSIEQELNRA